MTARPRVLVGTALLCTLTLGGVLTAGTAGATPGNMPVGHDQPFVGVVNGNSSNAVIAVNCPGPLRSGQTGHPIGGQTIGIGSPSATPASTLGYTGSRARSIVAAFVPASSVGASIKWMFSTYGNEPVPASLKLPCTGTSTVQFSPRPSSASARATRVSVSFEATCTGTVCPVDSAHRGRI